MRAIPVTLMVLASLLAAGTAFAADPPVVKKPLGPRYTMTPTNGGFIKMDTLTGVLSFCNTSMGALTCKMVPDDSAALIKNIEKATKQNDELKKENARLEDLIMGGDDAVASKPSGGAGMKLPTEREIDQAMDYVEHMYKKWRDKIRGLQKEYGKKPGTPL